MKQKTTLPSTVSSCIVYCLLLFTMLTMPSTLLAQVTIGENTAPQPYSVLEISTAATKGGLRLPHLSTQQRNGLTTAAFKSDAQAHGLTIYNTDTQCLEYWDSREWISLCASSASFSFNDDDIRSQLPVAGIGGTVGPVIPSGGEACTQNPPYKVEIIIGAEYLESTNIMLDETIGSFELKFLPNPTAHPRYAIVRVTDNCTNLYRDLFIQQLGNILNCEPTATIPVINGQNKTSICRGAELPLWLTNTVDGYEYIWLLNGREIDGARGTTYVATRAGKYSVIVGAMGCPNSTSSIYEITETAGTATTAPVISATNGGVMCGGGSVTLLGTGQVIDWYHNGIYKASGSSHTISAASDAGSWTAYATGACGSKQSNSLNITFSNASGGLNPIDAQVNGLSLTSATLCKGGSMELHIANAADYAALSPSYEWYANGNLIYSGNNPQVIINIPDYNNLVLEARVITSGNCPLSVSSLPLPLNPTELVQPRLNNGKTIEYICGSSGEVTLMVTTQTNTPSAYEWYKNGVKVSTTTTGQYKTKEAGFYQVRYTDGNCWSQLSSSVELVIRGFLSLSWVGLGVEDQVVGSEMTVGITAAPEALSYRWTSSNPAVIKVTQLPDQPRYATLEYLTVGTATITVEAENECGKRSIEAKDVVSQAGCANPDNIQFTSYPTSISAGESARVYATFTGGIDVSQRFRWTVDSPIASDHYVDEIIMTDSSKDIDEEFYLDEVGTWTIKLQAYTCDDIKNNATNPSGVSTSVKVTVYPEDITSIPDASRSYSVNGMTCFDNNKRGTGTSSFKDSYTFTYTLSGTPTNDVMAFVREDVSGIAESVTVNDKVITIVYKKSVVDVLDVTGTKFELITLFRGTGNVLYKITKTIRVYDKTCCGAYTYGGVWREFQCYNLGVTDQTLDPFTPSAGIHGAKYKYGAKNASLTQAEDQYNPSLVTLWNDKDQFPFLPGNGLWLPANNPCPPGYRVPYIVEWADVAKEYLNPRSIPVGAVWDNHHTNFSSGINFGDGLFLPATGIRGHLNGVLSARGAGGYYWAGETTGTSPGRLIFSSSPSSVNATGNSGNETGMAVRCIAE